MIEPRFRPEVVDDLDAGAKWYDQRQPGLGATFLAECKAALDRIAKRPEQGDVDADGLRAVRIHQFPYVIHFRVERTTVVIFAVMHGGRAPTAWRDRVT